MICVTSPRASPDIEAQAASSEEKSSSLPFQSNSNNAGRDSIPTSRVERKLLRVEGQILSVPIRRKLPKNGCTNPFPAPHPSIKHHEQGYGSCSPDSSVPTLRLQRCIRCRHSLHEMAVEIDRARVLS